MAPRYLLTCNPPGPMIKVPCCMSLRGYTIFLKIKEMGADRYLERSGRGLKQTKGLLISGFGVRVHMPIKGVGLGLQRILYIHAPPHSPLSNVSKP